MTITNQQRKVVRDRAGDCCKYCRLPQSGGTAPFHVDHIIPVKHGGADHTDNFCLACYKCNSYKGSDVGGFDPVTDELTRFYHPREQLWDDHFHLEVDYRITGLTAEGRTTTRVFRMNDEAQLQNRQILAEVGLYPCSDAE